MNVRTVNIYCVGLGSPPITLRLRLIAGGNTLKRFIVLWWADMLIQVTYEGGGKKKTLKDTKSLFLWSCKNTSLLFHLSEQKEAFVKVRRRHFVFVFALKGEEKEMHTFPLVSLKVEH